MRTGSGRRTRGLLAALVVFAMVVAACSGDGGDEQADRDAADVPEASDGGEDGASAAVAGQPAAVVLSDFEADGDALFPCGGAAGTGVVSIAYVQVQPVEHVGPTAEAFRAAVGDYNRRCGGVAAGTLEVSVGYAGAEDPTAVCASTAVENSAVVVTDAADEATATCLASSRRLLWHEGGATDAASAGTAAPPSVRAADSVAAALAEDVIGDRTVVVVHDGTPRREGAADQGVLPTLEEAGLDDVALVEATCDGGSLGSDLDGSFVISLLPAPCLADLTVEAGAAGADVRWLVIGDLLSLAPVDDAVFDASAFDSALAYEFAPTATAGLPRDRAPVDRDRACVEFLDGFTGHDTAFPSAAFAAHARLCSTLGGLFGALDAADVDLSPETVRGAVPEAARDLVLSQGQRSSPDAVAWLAPRWVTTVEWNADCTCWTYVRGPDRAPVD
ncbi:MAG: hypothetical protein AAF480_10770 [Actinomycetota bacterium]